MYKKIKTFRIAAFLTLFLTVNLTTAQNHTLSDVKNGIIQVNNQYEVLGKALNQFARTNNISSRKNIARKINREAKLLYSKATKTANLVNSYLYNRNNRRVSSKIINTLKLHLVKVFSHAEYIQINAKGFSNSRRLTIDDVKGYWEDMWNPYSKIADHLILLVNTYNSIPKSKLR
jgi:uncharacterized protein YxjI